MISAAVKLGAQEWSDVKKKIVAMIDEANVASVRAFHAAEFTPASNQGDRVVLEFVLR